MSEIERAKYDPVYWVRREATFALGALAKVVPEELVFVSLVRYLFFYALVLIMNVCRTSGATIRIVYG